jgi:hypothetical protein
VKRLGVVEPLHVRRPAFTAVFAEQCEPIGADDQHSARIQGQNIKQRFVGTISDQALGLLDAGRVSAGLGGLED